VGQFWGENLPRVFPPQKFGTKVIKGYFGRNPLIGVFREERPPEKIPGVFPMGAPTLDLGPSKNFPLPLKGGLGSFATKEEAGYSSHHYCGVKGEFQFLKILKKTPIFLDYRSY